MSEDINQLKLAIENINTMVGDMRQEGWEIAFSCDTNGNITAKCLRTTEENHDI